MTAIQLATVLLVREGYQQKEINSHLSHEHNYLRYGGIYWPLSLCKDHSLMDN
jgi:hypothetical protein